ncbi:alpha-1,6-mannosyltransferase subunit [Crucibulum laeve]|uniref:Mannosyltransferase n=1 Tax=Crucibulum laeve TaxID=68775 RepID=A0A5C3M6H5_9AGAR|nr:alpha-1,6-mannosyltransferase subunit [Crucibulum laeve]
MSTALDALILVTGWTHVLLAPYTKVEESFNLHAVHDVLMYGVKPDALDYDHFSFPSPVPRTFVGPLFLTWISTPLIYLAAWRGFVHTKFELQIIIRLALATLNAFSLMLVRRAASRRFGRLTGVFFALLTCSQFHLPFWMGRTIPNMFALVPVTAALALVIPPAPTSVRPLPRNLAIATSLITGSAIIFRAEIVLLLGPLCLQALIRDHISFTRLLRVGAISGLSFLALTVLVDTYFHLSRTPLWPEFAGFYFNVIEGKSAEWGTSPPLAYITTFLPKLLLSALPLSVIGILSDPRIQNLLLPYITFIFLISALGHKEWRFIVYVVPVFNVAAARGARWLVSRRKNSLVGRLMFLSAFGLILINVLLTVLSTRASIENYPGGAALHTLHELYPLNKTSSPVHVHISNLAAQTGASLFLQLNAPPYLTSQRTLLADPAWIYDKSENLTFAQLTASPSITHLITEVPPQERGRDTKQWREVAVTKGFDGWKLDRSLLSGPRKWEGLGKLGEVLSMEKGDKLWILERQK